MQISRRDFLRLSSEVMPYLIGASIPVVKGLINLPDAIEHSLEQLPPLQPINLEGVIPESGIEIKSNPLERIGYYDANITRLTGSPPSIWTNFSSELEATDNSHIDTLENLSQQAVEESERVIIETTPNIKNSEWITEQASKLVINYARVFPLHSLSRPQRIKFVTPGEISSSALKGMQAAAISDHLEYVCYGDMDRLNFDVLHHESEHYLHQNLPYLLQNYDASKLANYLADYRRACFLTIQNYLISPANAGAWFFHNDKGQKWVGPEVYDMHDASTHQIWYDPKPGFGQELTTVWNNNCAKFNITSPFKNAYDYYDFIVKSWEVYRANIAKMFSLMNNSERAFVLSDPQLSAILAGAMFEFNYSSTNGNFYAQGVVKSTEHLYVHSYPYQHSLDLTLNQDLCNLVDQSVIDNLSLLPKNHINYVRRYINNS